MHTYTYLGSLGDVHVLHKQDEGESPVYESHCNEEKHTVIQPPPTSCTSPYFLSLTSRVTCYLSLATHCSSLSCYTPHSPLTRHPSLSLHMSPLTLPHTSPSLSPHMSPLTLPSHVTPHSHELQPFTHPSLSPPPLTTHPHLLPSPFTHQSHPSPTVPTLPHSPLTNSKQTLFPS